MNNKTLKILLVEDFEFTRKMEADILKDLGFSLIAEAGNGKEALQKLEEEKDIGLIISDWNMPEINGYELLKKFRSDERFRSIPFIMATAQGEHDQAVKALSGGADQFITKPFSADDLEAVLRPVLSKIGDADSGARPQSPPQKTELTAAHIQITDHLPLGMLNHMITSGMETPDSFDLKTVCMQSWNPVRTALEKGEVDAAFLLAPLAMDIFSAGTPVRLVLLAHKNGSICVQSSENERRLSLHDYFKSKIFLLPHTLSVHHMLADMFLREIGLKLGPAGKSGVDVMFEVVPPVKMPELIHKNPNACGFAVAEPIGSKSIVSGNAKLLFYSGSLWENHPCCVVVMRQEFIEKHPDAAYEFTRMLVRAGEYIEEKPDEASAVAVRFLDPDGSLGLDETLMRHVLSQTEGIRTDDLFPVIEDLDRIQQYMHSEMGIGNLIDLEKFIDTRFAEAACRGMPRGISRPSAIHHPSDIVTEIIKKEMVLTRAPQKISDSEKFQMTKEKNRLSFRIASDMKLVNRVIQETKNFLTQLGFDIFSGMNLILRELLINAVEHGSRFNLEKFISCTILRMHGSLFKVTVEDEGEGFDWAGLDMAIPEDRQQVRRRGYPFINAFSEAVEFNESGNRITVFHRIDEETRFEVTEKDGRVVICPSGDITASEIDAFRALLKELTDREYTGYQFDFTHVEDIDSMGFSAFVVLARMVSEQGRKVSLEMVNANAEIKGLFEMTHMDEAYRFLQR